jgi:hypothetical protein
VLAEVAIDAAAEGDAARAADGNASGGGVELVDLVAVGERKELEVEVRSAGSELALKDAAAGGDGGLYGGP